MTALAHALDNRLWRQAPGLLAARARGLGDGLRGRRGRRPGRTVHLGFSVGEQDWLFTYIRKNGCSAFKQLIVDGSPWRAEAETFPSSMRFLRRRHALPLARLGLRPGRRAIFVHRDPVERIVSLFTNKFVARGGARAITAQVTAATGREVDALTFRAFVDDYLLPAWLPSGYAPAHLDPHVFTQVQQLAPIRYDHAIPLPGLHAAMRALLPAALADRWFLKPVNTTAVTRRAPGPAADVAAGELARRHGADGTLPRVEDFLDEALFTTLSGLYRHDLALRAAIEASPVTLTETSIEEVDDR